MNCAWVIFGALTRRSGYKLIRVGLHTLNRRPEALAAMEHSDPARLIKVESLGSEYGLVISPRQLEE